MASEEGAYMVFERVEGVYCGIGMGRSIGRWGLVDSVTLVVRRFYGSHRM